MNASSASEPLPPLFASWIAELLKGPIPRESRATCDDCAMCARSDEPDRPLRDYFDPVIKCCSYVPVLHNFLTGRILADDDPSAAAGRRSVERRVAEGVAVTPLGLGHPPVFSLLYDNSETAFGRSRNLRCPHYLEESGRCGIWRHRESTCATWFCKHVRGSIGYEFWQHSLHQLLMRVENDLARWSVLELSLDDDALRFLLPRQAKPSSITGDDIDNRVDREHYARLWGDWLGRECEFFIECAKLINTLSWKDVLNISGPDAHAYARITKSAYDKLLSDDIPDALKVGPMHLVQIKNGVSRVSTYSAFDPVDTSIEVLEALQYFDGRPTTTALADIAAEKRLALEPALIRKMVDFALLIPPEDDNPERPSIEPE